MGKPWEDYKEEIHDLYIRQNLPLKEVQEILKTRYGFDACKRAFQNQIEAWGFRKNVRSSEMQVYVQQKKLRKSDSEIDLPDETKKIITPRKARRFEKRSESLIQQKAASLELDPSTASVMAATAQHHHHHHQPHHHHHLHHNQPALHSPTYPQHRMPLGQNFPSFQYAQETFPSTSNAPSHDMPKYAGMTISLCDDANPGSFSLPVTRSPYDNTTYVNPVMTTSGAYAPTIPCTEAPMYDLTGDIGYTNDLQYLPSGSIKKNSGNHWYGCENPQNSAGYPSASAVAVDAELLTLCFSGSVEDVMLILEKGANPNCYSIEGETPLTSLVKGLTCAVTRTNTYSLDYMIKYVNNYNRVLEVLLKNGADPSTPNRMGEYPLQLLASRGYFSNLGISEEVRKQINFFIRQLSSVVNQGQHYPSYGA